MTSQGGVGISGKHANTTDGVAAIPADTFGPTAGMIHTPIHRLPKYFHSFRFAHPHTDRMLHWAPFPRALFLAPLGRWIFSELGTCVRGASDFR